MGEVIDLLFGRRVSSVTHLYLLLSDFGLVVMKVKLKVMVGTCCCRFKSIVSNDSSVEERTFVDYRCSLVVGR